MIVSVIIPAYNRAGMIGEAIESVLSQDYFQDGDRKKNSELLVIDDGSKDRTQEIVRSFGSRVNYIRQEHSGVSSARNLGLKSCRGSHVAFLDSDDIWLKDKLRIQMGFMKAFPSAAVCYTDEIWIRNGRRVNPKKKHQKFSGRIFDKVLALCLLSLSSALFRRKVFDEIGVFDEDLPACEDYDLGIRLAHRYDVHFIPKPLIVKRGGHPDQLSQAFSCMDKFRVKALEKAMSLDLKPEQRRLVEKEILKKCRILVQGYAKRGKNREADLFQKIMEKYAH
jgi:glycosyltransferase involved in cell wall biosynthesis